MRDALVVFPVSALVLSSALGLGVALYIAKRLGRFLNFRTMLILNYVLVNPVSGIVHLSDVAGASRGYFDIYGHLPSGALQYACLASVLGLIALILACSQRLPPQRPEPMRTEESYWLNHSEKQFLLVVGIIMLPITLYATSRIVSYAGTLDSERIISLDGGMARFSFLSNWTVWAVSFLAIWLVGGRAGRSRIFSLIVTALATVAIAISLSWTGGRSIIIVMVLPLILVALPRLTGVRWLAVPAGILVAGSYIIDISEARHSGPQQFSFADWLDWEWGRFSMSGFAADYVNSYGLLHGETFVAGIVNLLLGTLGLVGFDPPNPDLKTSTQISGSTILSNATLIYIVPGFSAELLMNFGMIGLIVGYYLLGRIANWTDAKFSSSPSALGRLAFAYLGTLLVFRTVAADSGSIYSYLLYSGAPVAVAAWWSWQSRKRDGRARVKRSVPSKPISRQ